MVADHQGGADQGGMSLIEDFQRSLKVFGAQGRNRTTDTVIFSHVLYQLSYLGADLAESEDQGERGGYRGSFLPCPGMGLAAGSAVSCRKFPRNLGQRGQPPRPAPRFGPNNYFEKLLGGQEPRRPRRV